MHSSLRDLFLQHLSLSVVIQPAIVNPQSRTLSSPPFVCLVMTSAVGFFWSSLHSVTSFRFIVIVALHFTFLVFFANRCVYVTVNGCIFLMRIIVFFFFPSLLLYESCIKRFSSPFLSSTSSSDPYTSKRLRNDYEQFP